MGVGMNRKTIGEGVRRETSDPGLMARAVEVREHLGLGEDFRVEDLSPAEFLKLQAEAALDRLRSAHAALEKAQEDFNKAWSHWLDAKGAEERADDE